MAEEYAYAVARIRVKELSLLSRAEIEQLMSCRDYKECLRTLNDLGWGSGGEASAEEILSGEMQKTWALMNELVGDPAVFRVFLYAVDFNNLKAAVKAVVTGAPMDRLFQPGGTVLPEAMTEAVRQDDFSDLPEVMRGPAQEAYHTLLHTHDGQLCDIILDQAALCAIYGAGVASGNDMISRYSELAVAAADIKIAVRGQKTGKTQTFLRRAMAPCKTLDLDSLIGAAVKGMDEIYAYLATTAYASAIPALKQSASTFEKWCDDLVMNMIRGQKSNPFGIGPLAAYFLARENEVRTVRILLSGKLNGLDEGEIRERLREMYV